MKTTGKTILLAAGLAMSIAHAGTNDSGRVYVNTNVAGGGLTDARFGAGAREYISCSHMASKSVAGSPVLSNHWMVCSAADRNGKGYACSVYNPPQAWVDTVAGLNAASFLEFRGDASGYCIEIVSFRSSSFL